MERIDARLPWPTGEAFGRLGPQTAEAIHLCSVDVSFAEDEESTASIPLAGRDSAQVTVRAAESQYNMIDPALPPAPTRLALPPEYAYLMAAPARIRLAVAANDQPTHVVTVEISADRHVPPDAPYWAREQAIDFSIHDGSLAPHPMVRTHFPPVGGA